MTEEMEEAPPTQLPTLVKEWMALRDETESLSAALREKRKRLKLVRDMISKIMKGNKLGQLKISAGSVRQHVKKAKAPFTKKYMISTLTGFFNGNIEMATKCAAYLDEHRPLRVSENLVLDAAE
jgi:hypothetical protein